MRYRKTEELKETGIEWIGDIPTRWDFQKLKWLLDEGLKYGANESADEENINHPRYIRITDFDDNGNLKDDTFKSLPVEFAKEYYLKEGDVLFARSGATVGKTFQFKNYNGVACYAGYLIKATPDTELIESDFLYYFTKTKEYEDWKNSIFIQATIQNISAEKYSNLILPLPSLPEQRAIAAFLDRKTAAIDALIQKKEQLIERLTEKRQALITRAVTKGLEPDVAMKDSGIEWLGEIPEEWEVKRLKFLMKTNPSKQEVSEFPDDFEVSFLPMEKIGETGELVLDETKELKKVFDGYTYFTNGDVTVAKITPCFENGKGALIQDLENDTGFGTTELTVFRPNLDKILPEYLYYITISYPIRKIGKSFMYGAGGQKRVPDDFFENFKLGIPSISKQQEIIIELSKELERLSTFRSKIFDQIEKLKEYRQSLISAAVTGKIDVREGIQVAQGIEDSHTIEDIAPLVMYFINECNRRQTFFGRVMAVKNYVLLHYLLNINPKLANFKRLPKGPHDSEFWEKVENLLKTKGWVTIEDKNKVDEHVKYTPNRSVEYKRSLENGFADDWPTIKKVVNEIATHDTRHAEILSTVYAAWNDLMIFRKEPSEENILNEVLNRWPGGEKQKITKAEWRRGIRRLQSLGIEPKGLGQPTTEQPELL